MFFSQRFLDYYIRLLHWSCEARSVTGDKLMVSEPRLYCGCTMVVVKYQWRRHRYVGCVHTPSEKNTRYSILQKADVFSSECTKIVCHRARPDQLGSLQRPRPPAAFDGLLLREGRKREGRCYAPAIKKCLATPLHDTTMVVISIISIVQGWTVVNEAWWNHGSHTHRRTQDFTMGWGGVKHPTCSLADMIVDEQAILC